MTVTISGQLLVIRSYLINQRKVSSVIFISISFHNDQICIQTNLPTGMRGQKLYFLGDQKKPSSGKGATGVCVCVCVCESSGRVCRKEVKQGGDFRPNPLPPIRKMTLLRRLTEIQSVWLEISEAGNAVCRVCQI